MRKLSPFDVFIITMQTIKWNETPEEEEDDSGKM